MKGVLAQPADTSSVPAWGVNASVVHLCVAKRVEEACMRQACCMQASCCVSAACFTTGNLGNNAVTPCMFARMTAASMHGCMHEYMHETTCQPSSGDVTPKVGCGVGCARVERGALA